MERSTYHIAQFNVALMRAPLTDPSMDGFTNRLDEINELAEASPGFVWRLKGDGGDATGFRPYDNQSLLVNLSVWDNVASLRAFTYETRHREMLAGRKQWFTKSEKAGLVLWRIPRGTVPTLEEAVDRLEALRRDGPTEHAFSFGSAFESA